MRSCSQSLHLGASCWVPGLSWRTLCVFAYLFFGLTLSTHKKLYACTSVQQRASENTIWLYSSWASQPEHDLRGKGLPCEWCLLMSLCRILINFPAASQQSKFSGTETYMEKKMLCAVLFLCLLAVCWVLLTTVCVSPLNIYHPEAQCRTCIMLFLQVCSSSLSNMHLYYCLLPCPMDSFVCMCLVCSEFLPLTMISTLKGGCQVY